MTSLTRLISNFCRSSTTLTTDLRCFQHYKCDEGSQVHYGAQRHRQPQRSRPSASSMIATSVRILHVIRQHADIRITPGFCNPVILLRTCDTSEATTDTDDQKGSTTPSPARTLKPAGILSGKNGNTANNKWITPGPVLHASHSFFQCFAYFSDCWRQGIQRSAT